MSRHSNRKRSQRHGHTNKLTAAPKRRPRPLWSSALKHVAQIAKDTTEAANTNRPNERKTDRKLDVTVIAHAAAEKALVADEAEKGYGLLVIRPDKTTAQDNSGFHTGVVELAAGFDGPLTIADARNDLLDNPDDSRLNILVPVNGTAPTRRAAELAIVLACASHAP